MAMQPEYNYCPKCSARTSTVTLEDGTLREMCSLCIWEHDTAPAKYCDRVNPMAAIMGSVCDQCGHSTLVHFTGAGHCPLCEFEALLAKLRDKVGP